MTETTIDAIRRLVESALEDVDDADARYKLRTALQLLVFVEDRQDRALSAIEAEADDELMERLRSLGYVE